MGINVALSQFSLAISQSSVAFSQFCVVVSQISLAISQSSLVIGQFSVTISQFIIAFSQISAAVSQYIFIISQLGKLVYQFSVFLKRLSDTINFFSGEVRKFSVTMNQFSVAFRQFSLTLNQVSVAIRQFVMTFRKGRLPVKQLSKLFTQFSVAVSQVAVALGECSVVFSLITVVNAHFNKMCSLYLLSNRTIVRFMKLSVSMRKLSGGFAQLATAVQQLSITIRHVGLITNQFGTIKRESGKCKSIFISFYCSGRTLSLALASATKLSVEIIFRTVFKCISVTVFQNKCVIFVITEIKKNVMGLLLKNFSVFRKNKGIESSNTNLRELCYQNTHTQVVLYDNIKLTRTANVSLVCKNRVRLQIESDLLNKCLKNYIISLQQQGDIKYLTISVADNVNCGDKLLITDNNIICTKSNKHNRLETSVEAIYWSVVISQDENNKSSKKILMNAINAFSKNDLTVENITFVTNQSEDENNNNVFTSVDSGLLSRVLNGTTLDEDNDGVVDTSGLNEHFYLKREVEEEENAVSNVGSEETCAVFDDEDRGNRDEEIEGDIILKDESKDDTREVDLSKEVLCASVNISEEKNGTKIDDVTKEINNKVKRMHEVLKETVKANEDSTAVGKVQNEVAEASEEDCDHMNEGLENKNKINFEDGNNKSCEVLFDIVHDSVSRNDETTKAEDDVSCGISRSEYQPQTNCKVTYSTMKTVDVEGGCDVDSIKNLNKRPDGRTLCKKGNEGTTELSRDNLNSTSIDVTGGSRRKADENCVTMYGKLVDGCNVAHDNGSNDETEDIVDCEGLFTNVDSASNSTVNFRDELINFNPFLPDDMNCCCYSSDDNRSGTNSSEEFISDRTHPDGSTATVDEKTTKLADDCLNEAMLFYCLDEVCTQCKECINLLYFKYYNII